MLNDHRIFVLIMVVWVALSGCEDQASPVNMITNTQYPDMSELDHEDHLAPQLDGYVDEDMELFDEESTRVSPSDMLPMMNDDGLWPLEDMGGNADFTLDMEGGVVSRDASVEVDTFMEDEGVAEGDHRFIAHYWSATHNSYEGGERGTIQEQLNQGVRAIEYDIHDNDFEREGYRLGHVQFGDAVAYGGGNPNSDSLNQWLDLINQWSITHPDHAPIILTIDLKDNLMDNRSYEAGNLAHLNDVMRSSLDRIWLPDDGLHDINLARGHVLCVLSGDQGTRRGYLHDEGHDPALAINSSGQLLEVHDSGTGNLWYWSGLIEGDLVHWKRHGRYDSGRRASALLNEDGDVIEVHQSEVRDRLWYSVGELSQEGELILNSADQFTSGIWPSLSWRDSSQGLLSLRYQRDGDIYEREGELIVSQGRVIWGSEVRLSPQQSVFERNAVSYQGKSFRVSNEGDLYGYPRHTLWISVSMGGQALHEAPIRYEQLCYVEWQRSEHQDLLLGRQPFGALPGGQYASLPEDVRQRKVIRGWEFSGRDLSSAIPQIPSTDTPYRQDYEQFIEALDVVE